MNPVRGRDRAVYHHRHLMLNYNYKIKQSAGETDDFNFNFLFRNCDGNGFIASDFKVFLLICLT
ncbi:MAG: hypothetical protein UX55_C0011G0022 [Candidatus Azambacteria bacterium GW2011_GWE2_46_45]|uniref:Uncharacterized protein n=1 Tax=Candidatus Azambacteria bacterium GW2011_GWE2_46_45 TaxID=1618625 RepID=A0A0G1SDR2_9BACT|nr:MAG: hypothetical protein UX55_C0011G0022 [Candidatus Azambacteria bacterium GW2011_GWE2_46_45]